MPLLQRRNTTSYVSTGAVETPPEAFVEQGSAAQTPIRDIVPDLISKFVELRTYHQMSTFHAATRSSLRSIKSSVMGADFYMEPCDETQDALDQSEFCWYNISEATSSPWLNTLFRIMKFPEYGFSMLEPVFENRDWAPNRKGANSKTYTMLKKLAPRPALSIQRIIYDDNGGPVEVIQNALRSNKDGYYRNDEVHIPISKLIIFTNDEEGGDLMGKSVLRSAYPHWYYIQHLYKIDAIQKERHAIGVPRVVLPPGIKDAKDKRAAKELASNLRTNEHAGVVQPDGWDINFIKLEGNMVNVISSIEHHNSMIMLNVLAGFLLAGLQEIGGGARAVSASQQDVFMKANKAYAQLICDAFNLYLIPQLMNYNFNTDKYPKFKVRNIGESRDLQQLAAGLASLFDKEILTPDIETEQWVRQVFDMPLKIGDRPALSATQIRELIQIKDGGGPSGPGNNSNASTVGANGGQGNMGKGNNVS